MKLLTVKHTPLLLLLLLLWFDRCESLIDNFLPPIFFPFGTDEGDNVVNGMCDGPINIPYEIFNYKTLYVCAHGLVSFGSNITSPSESIPRGYGPPFIAAYGAYCGSLRSHGSAIYYRSTSADTSLLAMTSHIVQQALSAEGFNDFQSRWVLVVTWHKCVPDFALGLIDINDAILALKLGHYDIAQLVLSSDAQRHVMVFHYTREVTVYLEPQGYDGRDEFNYFQIDKHYSRTYTNAGSPGRWVFRADRLPVRLVGSGVAYKGRLEVMYNGTWGTVCDDGFSDIDARVFCYHLGFGYNGQFIGQMHGSGTGRIWLDDVECTGDETDVMQCRHAGWGTHNCHHSQDVSISCFFDPATQYAVRLAGNPTPNEGRLELLHNGEWGTVCEDHYFTDEAAQVACNMLGFGRVGFYIHSYMNSRPNDSERIWLGDVHCDGTESDIASCRHRGWGYHSCRHRDDVSISCVPIVPPAAARTQHQQTTMTTKVYSQRSSSTPAAETGDSDVTETTIIVIVICVCICIVIIVITVAISLVYVKTHARRKADSDYQTPTCDANRRQSENAGHVYDSVTNPAVATSSL